MRFDFRPIDNLPRLAWCAYLTKGKDSIVVRHGPWVETRDDCFFEGAWNGPFEEGRFDAADTFTGTGGRLTQDGSLFAAPSHPFERIYSVRMGEQLVVSNSWTFLLVSIDDQPDLGHADYYFDLQHNFRGFRRIPATLRTQNGHAVSLIDARNLVVSAGLDIRYEAKRRSPEPQTYAQYVALLQTTVDLVIANAAHPGRGQRYRPVTMTSTGYDSTAVSALVAKAGCTEAVTYARLYQDGPDTGDDGSQIAQRLGMAVKTYARFEYRERADFPEAEFCIAGPINWGPLSAMEETLVGALLCTGAEGYIRQHESSRTPPHRILLFGAPLFPTASIAEFRLRIGFVAFHVLNAALIHHKATRRITCSEEMRPWVLSSADYNAPILRRLAEEAGVPRSWFGQKKRASAYSNLADPKMFSPASLADFTAFCRSNKLPTAKDSRWHTRWIARLSRRMAHDGSKVLGRLPFEFYLRLSPYTWWLYPKASHRLWRSPALYTFHWGFERTKERYQIGSVE
jgi:hypothetical protein